MPAKIKAILAEDVQSYREGLAYVLKGHNIEVIALAANGLELLSLLNEKGLQPDVILLDIEMPEMDGKTALVEIRKTNSRVKIIMLSTYYNNSMVSACKQDGANAFLAKDSAIEDIIGTIRCVHTYSGYTNIPKNVRSLFTTADLEVVQLILLDKTTAQIARLRGKSIKTIEAHRKRLYKKAGVSSLAAFITFCRKLGLEFLKQESADS